MSARPSKSWETMVEPIVRKCRLAVMLDMNASFNKDGSIALADLLEQMARVLDEEVEVRRAD